MTQEDQIMILRKPAVMKMTGLPSSTLYHLMARGEFPANIKLGYRAVGWNSADIQAWIRSKLSGQSEDA